MGALRTERPRLTRKSKTAAGHGRPSDFVTECTDGARDRCRMRPMKSEYTANRYMAALQGVESAGAELDREGADAYAAFVRGEQRRAERLASQHFTFGYDPYNSADRFMGAAAFKMQGRIYVPEPSPAERKAAADFFSVSVPRLGIGPLEPVETSEPFEFGPTVPDHEFNLERYQK